MSMCFKSSTTETEHIATLNADFSNTEEHVPQSSTAEAEQIPTLHVDTEPVTKES